MRTSSTAFAFMIFFSFNSSAQEFPLILDKPGTFEILRRTDYVSPEYKFTKAEITANLEAISELVNIVRKNPVLADIKGFDGRARIYSVGFRDPFVYAIPSRISFEFCSWYRNKEGTQARATIEPPEWTVIINKLVPNTNRAHFSSAEFYNSDSLFMPPPKKETVVRGIDVYDNESFVIYNPDRPDYWLPVTVEEAFNFVRGIFKKETNKAALEQLMEMLEADYAAISASDRTKPAYRCCNSTGVGLDSSAPRILKMNPEYWNRNLPRSAIQFLYFTWVPGKDYYGRLKDEYLQHNSIGYSLYRFLESFGMDDIRSLVQVIKK